MKIRIIALLLVANFSYSQEKIPFIDYTEIKEQITKSSSEGDYDKTLALIDKINKNDSIYYTLLTSKSYYLLQLEKHNEAIKVTNKGINDAHEDSKVFFYVNKGVALTSLKKYDEAIEIYSQGIKVYPKNYLLHFNKAVVLETQGKLNEAVSFYKESILLNPLNRKPHLQIGNIYYKQDRLTQALMCFNMYLLLEPDADGAFEVLKSLNNVVVAKNPNERNIDLELVDADDSYDEIDLVLSSKIAMNEKYETGNPINIALTKQNHAMIEKLKDFDGNDNFWTQKYVPIYNWISENNYFDDFVYTMSYAIENETYKKIIEKKTKNITSFLAAFKTKWVTLASKNKIDFKGKKQEVFYEYDGDFVNAIGKKENEISIGTWEFFNASGQIIANGSFNNEEKKIGEWTWFNYLNEIKETASYENGTLEGSDFMFYNNGKKYINASYKNDELEGKYEYFNDKGALIQRKYFKQGKLEGVYTSYFRVGEEIAEFIIPYKNNLIEGEVIEFYANGDVYEKTNYVADKINGVVKKYYHNNKISSEIAYVDGDLNGSYKSYFTNGQITEIGQSIDGFYDGEWKTYYADGTLESEFSYKKGDLNDRYKFYDSDGILYYEYSYRNGEMIAYTFFNKDGSLLKDGKKKGGEFFYEGFSAKGYKTSEGLYDIEGGKKKGGNSTTVMEF
jgi:antitoxin component YwqK of YwqJK toxin-antitoxin module